MSRLVKVYQADSPYFKIISPPDIATKVAPGMPTIFKIQFIPTEKKVSLFDVRMNNYMKSLFRKPLTSTPTCYSTICIIDFLLQ